VFLGGWPGYRKRLTARDRGTGRDCRQWPLLERKNALADLLADVPRNGAIRYAEHIEGDGPTVLRHACAMRLEGIVSKLRDAPYRSGRDQAWRY
jgi:bifunctional non-homologous end joining protein LigD